ncbi:WYL domain-containing protein [Actinoplanes oblitus]|uniref:WYL domain-containing protein n=1 Tax=Actinoplanes oblitus TaxID=3040509 RepID=A0ABY8W6U1_9ACTN|nr:WYL domain-containing protein [Actinoplanes oblitus]WIM93564.1 WYL domain-containing protein [Actinoplanes oblitus]
MRADRLVSLVLLLRQRGRLTADTLARELEVSTRTVLRDIEALSAAGVPVYAERGRHGGFALLPGFRTELTGLNHDEALALLTAGSGFGLGAALASARRKVADALPASHRATDRLLVEPETDLLSRRQVTEEVPAAPMAEVRRAVLAGRRLRVHYAAAGQEPRWRTVDPIGLVTVRGRGYLLATRGGEDRTYRLSRVLAAEALAVPAQRPDRVDLDRIWAERRARFLADGHLTVLVRVHPDRREDLLASAVAVRAEEPDPDGWLRLEVTFQDSWHAEWALWQLATQAEALSPPSLRTALAGRAAVLAARYAGFSVGPSEQDDGVGERREVGAVALRVDLTFDCVRAAELAAFWKVALGYVDEPPPAPFRTRDEWVASFGEPADDEGGGAWLHDPDGAGPRLVFLEVPEPKVAKNRLHIDVRVGRHGEPWPRILAKVAELRAIGGRVVATFDGHHVVMADPEGNEFCVAA